MGEVIIEYLDLSDGDIKAELYATAAGKDIDSIKIAALHRIGVEQDLIDMSDDLLEAYNRYLHQVNGLEFQQPSHKAIADAVMLNSKLMRFVWWLA